MIVSLICAEAKRQRKQYTKRMLPWFVIPECTIMLDLAVLVANLDSDTVVPFKVDQRTGKLDATGHVADVPEPACLK